MFTLSQLGCKVLWWVCLSVCLSACKYQSPNFTKFCMHVGCGSVLLWCLYVLPVLWMIPCGLWHRGASAEMSRHVTCVNTAAAWYWLCPVLVDSQCPDWMTLDPRCAGLHQCLVEICEWTDMSYIQTLHIWTCWLQHFAPLSQGVNIVMLFL